MGTKSHQVAKLIIILASNVIGGIKLGHKEKMLSKVERL